MTEELPQAQNPTDNSMFQDAVMALRKGDKARAKDLLTALLKTDQNNPTYWIWLSAAMESPKERVYCLQTALKLDPQNATAKRGLILLGALPPDETIQPFPLQNRPRVWEEKLLLANEKPREKGLKGFMKNPTVRLTGIALVFVGLIAAVVFGFILPRQTRYVGANTNTPGPSPTFTATPTLFGSTSQPTKGSLGPTPLWMMLKATYTPTAAYVNTPHSGATGDYWRAAKDAYAKGDWDAYISAMRSIIKLEPGAADVPYLIGEAYRAKGDARNAIKAYNDALKVDDNFGPAYLGLALARLMDDPKAAVEPLFEEALTRNPDFTEVYIERARYYISRNKADLALKDLDSAARLQPNSPEVYLMYAQAYMAKDDSEKALEAAQQAYALDITMLPVYQMLGELYIDNGQYERAIEALNVYVTYEPEGDTAFAMLGQAYFELKDYKSAVENLNRAFTLRPKGLQRYHLYRGLADLELGNVDQAVDDLEIAHQVDEKSFEINLGLTRAYYAQEKFGSAFLQAEALKVLAQTDEQKALALYWHALALEKRDQPKDAIKDWQALLAMSKTTMTSDMRQTAEQHLLALASPTPSRTPTNTPTPSKTPTPTKTKRPTSTPVPSRTPRPTATPVPSNTPVPTSTPTKTLTPIGGIPYTPTSITITVMPTWTPTPK